MRMQPRAVVVSGLAAVTVAMSAGMAHAQTDATPPAIDVAVLDPPASHQLNGWYRQPVTVHLRATDDVAVAQFEYSTDSGGTYTTVPVTPAGTATASVVVDSEALGSNTIRYRARDTGGNVSTVPSPAGRTASIRIDTRPPEATFPQIMNGRVGRTAQLVPARSDPAPGSGNAGNVAVLDMWLDGELVYPLPIDTGDLALGLHWITLELGDPAGNAQKVTHTFIVTTSFADVEALIARFETAGEVSAEAAAALRQTLLEAQEPAAAGDGKQAGKVLNQFVEIANAQVPNGAARSTLVGDARYLIAELNDRLPAEPETGTTTEPADGPTVFPDPQLAPLPHNPDADFDVLVFSRTSVPASPPHPAVNGFRHDHIPHTVLAIQQLGVQHNFNVDVFDPQLAGASLPTSPFLSVEELRKYETIVFESPVGHNPGPLNPITERPNFETYIRGGGGYVGIHGAADMARTGGSPMAAWPWYANLVGGWFINHPNGRSGFGHCGTCIHTEVLTEDGSHPATEHLPETWTTVDELYNFDRGTIRSDVHTLLSLNEDTYRASVNSNIAPTNPLMGGDHPIAWCQNWEDGKAFSNILGHARWQYYNERFMAIVLGGIETTAGRKDANCSSYRETRLLIDSEAAAGRITQAAAEDAGALLESARTSYLAKRYTAAIPALNAINALSNEKASGEEEARAALGRQARDLRRWMQDLQNGA
jgi:type 1 glutamine amidotransferase